MKGIFIAILIFLQLFSAYAQNNAELHHGSFKKNKILMSSL